MMRSAVTTAVWSISTGSRTTRTTATGSTAASAAAPRLLRHDGPVQFAPVAMTPGHVVGCPERREQRLAGRSDGSVCRPDGLRRDGPSGGPAAVRWAAAPWAAVRWVAAQCRLGPSGPGGDRPGRLHAGLHGRLHPGHGNADADHAGQLRSPTGRTSSDRSRHRPRTGYASKKPSPRLVVTTRSRFAETGGVFAFCDARFTLTSSFPHRIFASTSHAELAVAFLAATPRQSRSPIAGLQSAGLHARRGAGGHRPHRHPARGSWCLPFKTSAPLRLRRSASTISKRSASVCITITTAAFPAARAAILSTQGGIRGEGRSARSRSAITPGTTAPAC